MTDAAAEISSDAAVAAEKKNKKGTQSFFDKHTSTLLPNSKSLARHCS